MFLRFFLHLIRVSGLLVCLLIVPAAYYFGGKEDSNLYFARDWLRFASPLLAVCALLAWHFALGWGAFTRRRRHVAIAGGSLLLGGLLFFGLMRHEGSMDGGSFPRFAFRWAPKPETLAPLAPEESEVTTGSHAQPSPPPEGAADSAQFLGPERNGAWPKAAVSLDWGKNPPEEVWRIPMGLGWSSFAVSGGRALTQEQRQERELVTCYDLATGRLLWIHGDPARLLATPPEGGGPMGGDGPRATPTIWEDRVLSYGATGILNCLDLSTGMPIWTRQAVPSQKLPRWGNSCSPLILEKEGLVVVNGVESSSPTLLAFDLEDGAPAWTVEGRGASYSSPRLLTLLGVRQIVSINGHDVTGHDPATGQELWRFEWPGIYPKVAQPTPVGSDRLLLTASYGAGSHLIRLSKADNGTFAAAPLWKTTRMKTKFSSPVVVGEHAYGIDEGTLACVSLDDGKRVWKGGKVGFGQNLLVRDQLLIQAEDGRIVTVPASPSPPPEAMPTLKALSSLTWNTPVLAGRYLLVRNAQEAVCYRLAPASH